MLVCTLDGDLYPPLEEPTGTDPKSKKKDKDKDKKFVWNHGSKYFHKSVFWRVCVENFIRQQLWKQFPFMSDCLILTSAVLLSWFAVTCPLKNTRKRRFRKTAKKKVMPFSVSLERFPSFFPSISLASCLMIHLFPKLSSNKTFTFYKTATVVKVKTKIYI